MASPRQASLWVASDWHLGTRSPRVHRELVQAFLRQLQDSGDRLVLNGDIWEGLFEREPRARQAHPAVVAALDELQRQGRLEQTQGNHDPDTGVPGTEVSWPGLGRILISHGHGVDPLHGSGIGRLGDTISRHFGSLLVVRGAARVANLAAEAIAGEKMVSIFRQRCLESVSKGGYSLGIFGHVHRQYYRDGDPYVNSGWLSDERLEYLVLDSNGIHLRALKVSEVVR